MATVFKTFLNDDITTTRSLLHEAIPITGSIVYGTYVSGFDETNIKLFPHGMFESVYDYPYLSSSANHIFDLTVGVSEDGDAYPPVTGSFTAKKRNIYNHLAQVLVGHDVDGNILSFDQDGDIVAGGTKYEDLFFVNIARLLSKDEIKKGSFRLDLGVSDLEGGSGEGEGTGEPCDEFLRIEDEDAEEDYRVNSPAGEFGILRVVEDSTSFPDDTETNANYDPRCGLIFYQAGVVALTYQVFRRFNATLNLDGKISSSGTDCVMDDLGNTVVPLLMNRTIEEACDALRARICDMRFVNTTELNSTIYFCRINHNDFNYSSNPTYTENSKIRVKRSTIDAPVTYFTTVGLYSADNELLAVAKLSEPLRKDPTNELTLRARLDY